MKKEEIKQMAEAKALEKYPVEESFKGCTYCEWGGGIEDINEEARFVYSQAVIDTYKEPEMVNEKLLDLVNEVLKVWNEDGDNGEIQMKTPIAWHRVVTRAEAIQSSQQQEKNDGWISVEDRLPDTGERVLICRDKGWIELGEILDGWFVESQEYTSRKYTTHWMLLPNPPKEK